MFEIIYGVPISECYRNECCSEGFTLKEKLEKLSPLPIFKDVRGMKLQILIANELTKGWRPRLNDNFISLPDLNFIKNSKISARINDLLKTGWSDKRSGNSDKILDELTCCLYDIEI
ncbi:MAG: hypothetical protein ABIF12_00790 [bacterium]